MSRLRELRMQHGKTLKEVGEELFISESTMSRIENSQRDPKGDILKRFAEYYNVSTDYILGREEEMRCNQDDVSLNVNLMKQKRKMRRLTQDDMGKLIGVDRTTYGKYETEQIIPTFETLFRIADVLGVSVDELVGRTVSDVPKINVYASVRAGYPVDMDNDIVDTVDITRKMAETGDYFGVYVKGDSMMPKFEEGDLLVVRKQESVENGEIAVVAINNEEATVKKVKYIADKIQLIPFNIQYEPMEYSADEVTIIGKVIEVRRSL